VRKLQDRGASHGILIALNGITGDGDQSAHSEVLGALIRDKIKILVLTRGEILGLTITSRRPTRGERDATDAGPDRSHR